MIENIKSIMHLFDLIGKSPQLLIFQSNRYKSILSSLFSLIIILISIAFSIYSLLEYLKYMNPNTTFLKDNDEGRNTKENLLNKFNTSYQVYDNHRKASYSVSKSKRNISSSFFSSKVFKEDEM